MSIKAQKITVVLIVVFILTAILTYIIYHNATKDKQDFVYYDITNSLYYAGDNYVTVGISNNNDNYFEKAKITRYNKKKEKLFEKIYNKGYSSLFADVIIDDGNYVAVGNYVSTIEEFDNNYKKGVIAKYDKDGNLLYDFDFQILDSTTFNKIVAVDDGYIVVGSSLASKKSNDAGGAIIVKYSKEGKVMWKSNYGNSFTAVYNSIIINNDYIFAVGMNKKNVGIVAQYSLDGKFISCVEYSGLANYGFRDIAIYDDNIYVVSAKVEDDERDALIVRYDFDLDYIDEVVYDYKGNESYEKILVDKDNLIVMGNTTAITSKKANKDGLIGKYSMDFSKGDVIHYGDEKIDQFNDIKLINGEYLITGYSSYEDGNNYLNKFIRYSDALKVLEVS